MSTTTVTTATTAPAAPSRICEVTPTDTGTSYGGAYGAHADHWTYLGPDAVALLRAAGELVPADARPAIRITATPDHDSECPRTWCNGTSWAVSDHYGNRGNRNTMPESWTTDAYLDPDPHTGARARFTLDADDVSRMLTYGGQSWSTDETRFAVRALSLSGARGVHAVDLCSHSTEWLNRYDLADARGHVRPDYDARPDALAWVPAEVIASEYPYQHGRPVTYAPESGWTDSRGVDVSADVQAWAAARVKSDFSVMDAYVRGDVFGVMVDIIADTRSLDELDLDELDPDGAAWASADADGALWGIYGDDANPTDATADPYALVDVLGEAWYAICAATDAREGARRRAEAGGLYVI